MGQKEKEKLEIRLIEIQEEIPLVENEIKQNQHFFQQAEQTTEILKEVNKKIEILCENESILQSQFYDLLVNKSLVDFSENDFPLLLWRIGLSHLCSLFQTNHINGEMFIGFERELWEEIGLSQQEICAIFYYKELIVSPGFIKEEKKKMEKLKGKKE